MRRIAAMAVCLTMVCAVGIFAQKAPAKKTVAKKKAAPAPVAAKPAKEGKFGMQASPTDVIYCIQGSFFTIQSESILAGGNMLYFAAKDFTDNKDLIVKKLEKNEVKVDTPERKMVKSTFSLGDANQIIPGYKLEVYSEARKGLPFVALYTKFYYTGSEAHNCGVNWGLSCAYAKNKYKYYTISKEGKAQTFKLDASGDKKIGQSKWIYVHDGKGSGAGLICPAVMLGKGEDFIFVNSVPPQKEMCGGQSMDAFMIFMPIAKPTNYKILGELYSQVANISWKFE